MELPPQINALIQHQLGRRALAIQAEYGRGVWIVTATNDGEEASFTPLARLPELFGGGSRAAFDDLLLTVQTFDPLTQVIVIFNVERHLQVIALIDIK